VTGRAFFEPRYSRRRSLWHRSARATSCVLAIALGLAAGGCSYKLGSLLKDKESEKPSYTATTPPGARTDPPGEAPAAGMPPEGDLAFARAAASEALTRDGKDVSVPWENPRTGARGTVIPLSSASTQDGVPCRDFLVSYVLEGTELWLQGEACRLHEGRWEVRNLRPWKRS
jgi:17 kDa outer membrane surface antigen